MCVAKNTLRGESVFSPIYGRKSAGRSDSYICQKRVSPFFDKLKSARIPPVCGRFLSYGSRIVPPFIVTLPLSKHRASSPPGTTISPPATVTSPSPSHRPLSRISVPPSTVTLPFSMLQSPVTCSVPLFTTSAAFCSHRAGQVSVPSSYIKIRKALFINLLHIRNQVVKCAYCIWKNIFIKIKFTIVKWPILFIFFFCEKYHSNSRN